MPVFMKTVPPRPQLPSPPQRIEGAIDPEKLAIMYVLLTHNTPYFSMRLIDALNEPQVPYIMLLRIALYCINIVTNTCILVFHSFFAISNVKRNIWLLLVPLLIGCFVLFFVFIDCFIVFVCF